MVCFGTSLGLVLKNKMFEEKVTRVDSGQSPSTWLDLGRYTALRGVMGQPL